MGASLSISYALILLQSKFVSVFRSLCIFDRFCTVLTNLISLHYCSTEDDITHILHVCKELPLPSHPHEFADSNGDRNGSEPSQ